MGDIETFCTDLVKSFKPSRVVLFGSYARGNPTADSDVDLLITVGCEPAGPEAAARMIAALNPSFAVDLIVKTEKDVERRLGQHDYFLQQIHREGRVLYETAHA
ncbi:MAG TPA: nucleotidyltransferase domain-containing protein [Kiritimatiellia bacterium]|nr:nucleotidyltransferase domain-containing protein [Kiritimatiellia bacterium]HMP96142.1 nucleotidyltransferase domain-containing protein [Kiritimatiellia bacterium]